jgi:fused signal recognition particle receptor
LAGNDTVNQAREFFHYTNYDGSILTKSDADSKGGAAISITYLTHKPILYLGVGQGYEDLAEFDHDKFLDSIFKDKIYEKTISHSDVDNVASLPDNDTATTLDSDTNIVANGNENTSNEYDKILTTDQQTSAFLVEPEQLIPSKMNHEQERIHEETSEAKSKKGSFFNKFFRDKKEDGTDNVENVSNEEIRPKKRNKKETKNKSENVVYLTDDDLDDLVK